MSGPKENPPPPRASSRSSARSPATGAGPKPAPSPAGAPSPAPAVKRLLPEMLSHHELMGKLVRLSSGQTGEVVHVEYDAPSRVALVKTFPETPSPLTRVAVDRYSPAHLPAITEILGDAREGREADGGG